MGVEPDAAVGEVSVFADEEADEAEREAGEQQPRRRRSSHRLRFPASRWAVRGTGNRGIESPGRRDRHPAARDRQHRGWRWSSGQTEHAGTSQRTGGALGAGWKVVVGVVAEVVFIFRVGPAGADGLRLAQRGGAEDVGGVRGSASGSDSKVTCGRAGAFPPGTRRRAPHSGQMASLPALSSGAERGRLHPSHGK